LGRGKEKNIVPSQAGAWEGVKKTYFTKVIKRFNLYKASQ
jgi:hypothetical protein